MKNELMALAAFAVASLLPVAAQATTALDYNVLVRNDFYAPSSDTQGRIAAGGNISVSSYTIGANATGGGYVAVAGGTFTGGFGSDGGGNAKGNVLASNYVNNGHFTIEGSADTYSGGKTSPISIASEMARLTTLSTDLHTNAATYGTVGTVSLQNANVTFSGSGSANNIYVFNVTDAVMAASTSFTFSLPTGAIAVLNISANANGSASTVANTGTAGINASNVLYNFYDSAALNLTTLQGSILAPSADITTNGGVINGQVFGNSWNGTTQVNSVNFAGTSLLGSTFGSVPEPATWAMMLIGFGAIGVAIRGQKRSRPTELAKRW